jgi:hypothetical protein
MLRGVLALALLLSVQLTDGLTQDDEVRKSLKASSSQTIGVDTEITVVYSRPGVKGRKIWGDLVPYGMYPGNQYSNNKPYPWRAGADETTVFEVSKDVLIDGKKLPAGKYGLHMVAGEKEWMVMFNKDMAWGSYGYDAANDVLKVTVKPIAAPHQEWLSYKFEDLAGTSATVVLHWEKLKVPFKVQTAE